jgi:hypothetical protein
MPPLDFLRMLWGNKPAGLYILIWTLQGKRSRWFRDFTAAAKFVDSHATDVYVGVGLSECDYGENHRCTSEKVAGLAGFWADFDLRSEAHSKKPLPANIEEALSLIPPDLPPTTIISTGNGLHAWWLFQEPWVFENDQEREAAITLAYRFQTLFQHNSSQRSWAFDRLADLARVLRIPGTTNAKDPAKPKPVEVYSVEGRRYEPSGFRQYLDKLSIPDEKAEDRATKDSAERFVDRPLVINLDAAIPDEMLKRLMEQDLRFRHTWNRQRHDLNDQSQSGYDMALGDFGMNAGLTDQEIVDLIVHHRRIHGQRPRTRLDYFQRTIATAFKRNESITPAKSFQAPVNEFGQPSSITKPESPTVRELLCEQISSAIGVRVLKIVKIDGQEPTYRVELEATKIGFPSVDKLVGQQSFRMKIASAVDHLVPRIPPKIWDRVAQMMLNALTVEDGGDEANLVGAAKMYVQRYLSETSFIDAEEDHPYQTRFKPTIYEGQVAICAHDLQQHINKAWGENRAIKDVPAMLSALGASSTRLKRTRLRDQSRWLLPSSEFVPDAYIGASKEMCDARLS